MSPRRRRSETLPPELVGRIDPVCDRFESAWRAGERPRLEDFLAQVEEPDRRALLVELIPIDMNYRLRVGEAPRVETYLERFPALTRDGHPPLELLAAEYALRRRREPDLTATEYARRFPQYEEQLAGLSAEASLPAETASPPSLPDGGATLDLSGPDSATTLAGLPRVPGYELLDILGRGGMGVVYKARHLRLKRIVALKMVLAGVHAGEEQLARFRAEAEAVARLQHPNIVQVYDIIERDGWSYLALEYVPGGSLSQQLKEKRLSAEEAARLVEMLARAIHYAHKQGVVHRDLKPSNILLGGEWRGAQGDLSIREPLHRSAPYAAPKITDFGLAKRLDMDQGQTPSGAILGTPSYMAPEQASGKSKQSGPAADVYSLGAILYELLTGQPPFRGETVLDTLMKALSSEPVPPRQLGGWIPAELERICLKCLQKDPVRRYPSAAALAEDLHRFLNSEPVPEMPSVPEVSDDLDEPVEPASPGKTWRGPGTAWREPFDEPDGPDEPASPAKTWRGPGTAWYDPVRPGGRRRRLFLMGLVPALLLAGLVLLFRAVSRPGTPPAQHSQQGPGAGGERSGTEPGGRLAARPDLPDLQISQPAMLPVGLLAVQALPGIYAKYAEGRRAVVLILDCSGSMGARQRPDGPTRFDEARAALKRVLAEILPGPQVSVWAFSHKFDVNNPNLSFAGKNPEDHIQRLYFAKKWDKQMLAEVGPRIDALQYYNETPIVRAMTEARKDFTDQHSFKTMVVLTDGMDNGFEAQPANAPERPGWQGDAVLNPGGKLTIPQYLARAFAKSDIAIRIVGFQLPPHEQRIAERQFKGPLERLPKQGRFYLVQDTKLLVKALRESLKQRLSFTLEDRNSGQFKGGTEINLIGDPDFRRIALAPGLYDVVIDARKQLRQKVAIRPGDRLLLTLHENGAGLELRVELMQHVFRGQLLGQKVAEDWLVTVLQNQRQVQEDALQLTATAENLHIEDVGSKGTLGHVTPRLILFEVRPQDNPKARLPSLRYYPLADYTAPAWGLDVKPWVRDKKPVLEAFWSKDAPPVAGVLRRGQHFGDDLQVLPGGGAAEVQLSKAERGPVRLLSANVEKHTVDMHDGKRQEVSCLVVRLSFPPGKPVMAQLPSFSGGQEHRFYSAAGKYTGIFWEVTMQQAQQQVQSLNLISLAGFREAALAAGQHVRIELSAPNNHPRPRPPQ